MTMPVSRAIALLAFVLAALVLPRPALAQIVALGASNTAGQGVGAAKAFPAQLQALLAASGRRMTVRNAGVNGDTTAGMLARFDSAVPAGTQVVVLQFGGNDARRGIDPAQRQANINAILAKVSARGARAVQADDLVASGLRSGLTQADGIHLTVEGHAQVARALAGRL
jgi:acyl-CoA thioesterase-1